MDDTNQIGNIAAALANLGAVGLILKWFMGRVETLMQENTRALNRMTRTQLLAMINSPVTHEPIKEQAKEVLKELDRDSSSPSGGS